MESLKDKFDKLAYVHKKTGEPTINPQVRRAKIIYRNIQSRMLSMALRNPDENMNPTEADHNRAKENNEVSGARRPRNAKYPSEQDDNTEKHANETNEPQQKKTKRLPLDQPLERRLQMDVVRHMETMTSSLISVAEVIEKTQSTQMSSSDIRKVVREELQSVFRRGSQAQTQHENDVSQVNTVETEKPLAPFMSRSVPHTADKPNEFYYGQ